MSFNKENDLSNKSKNIRFLTRFSILLAIEAIVCFTPLGSLPALGPIVMTLSHLPVIIAAIMLGTEAGMAMGFFFGLFSFLVWSFAPPAPPIAFVFTPVFSFGEVHGSFYSILICFVPRILIGLVAGLSFKLFSKIKLRDICAYGLSGLLGSLTNTFLVLSGIYFFFGKAYSGAIGKSFDVLLGYIGTVILTNGVPEAILGAVVAYAVCRSLKVSAVRAR